MSWNIVSGFAGYVSLGHSVFLGLGAYTGGLLAEAFQVNPLWFLPVAVWSRSSPPTLVGSVVIRARGPCVRDHHHRAAAGDAGAGQQLPSVTNGSNGVNVPLPTWSTDYQNMPFYYMFLVLLLAATVGFAAWVRRTKFGTGLLAIREDEDKAAAIGVNTTRYKVLAYAASAVPIGIAGVVYAYFLSFLNPIGAFSLLTSVTIVLRRCSAAAGRSGARCSARSSSDRHRGGQRLRRRDRQPLTRLGIALVLVASSSRAGSCPTVAARPGPPAGGPAEGRVHRPGRGRAPLARRSSSRPARRPPPSARAGPAARDQGRQEELRRPARGRRRRPHGRGRVDHRADRPERLGQDDAVQPGHRRDAARRGRDLVRRHAHRPAAAVGAGPPRPGPHLPDHPAVHEHDGAGERGVAAADGQLGAHGQGRRQRARGRAGAASCSTSSGSAGSATSRPAPCPTASRSSSSWPRCSCSSRR